MMAFGMALLISLVAAGGGGGAPVVARPAADSLTTTYMVGGVKVIHRRANISTVVTNLYLLGGVRSAPAAHAGIENFLLQVRDARRQIGARDTKRK